MGTYGLGKSSHETRGSSMAPAIVIVRGSQGWCKRRGVISIAQNYLPFANVHYVFGSCIGLWFGHIAVHIPRHI